MVAYVLLPHSQPPATSHDSEPVESSPHPLTARCKINLSIVPPYMGYAVAQLVEALCYKPEGRGFDSRWCRWKFSLT
jgi:hypothetical protein